MTETLNYELIESAGKFELRSYPAHIRAEVSVFASSHRSAAEKGFGVLASYIFGNNTSRQNIAMTSPVTAAPSEKIAMTSPVTATPSEKIAMTTPVTVSGSQTYTIAFIMPSSTSMDTLPLPNDQRVRLIPVSAHRAAAVRFSGYFNPKRIAEQRNALQAWLKEKELETEGEYTVAGYNPPWVPGFLARNEIWVRLKD